MIQHTPRLVRRMSAFAAILGLAALAACDSSTGQAADSVDPQITLTAPAAGALNGAEVEVSGTATDNRAVARITWSLNGGAEVEAPITEAPSVAFSFGVTLAQGANTLRVTAYDAAGNVKSATVSTTLDTDAPALELAGPAVNARVVSPTVSVSGTAGDPSGVAKVSFDVDGGPPTDFAGPFGVDGAFTVLVPVSLGAHTIGITATDAAGNARRIARQVERVAAGEALLNVLDAADGSPVADARITATLAAPSLSRRGPRADVTYPAGAEYGVENLGGGHYRLLLPVGSTYTVQVARDGDLPASYNGVSAAAGAPTYLETVRMVESGATATGGARVEITDAFSGAALSNVALTLRSGLNATQGAIVAGATTNGGAAVFADLDAGYYTVEMSRGGYAAGYFTLYVIGGETGTFRGSIAPQVSTQQVRIILDWGETPSDLDSHLTGPTGTPNRFHVFYQARGWGRTGEAPSVALDHDDTSSFGPETITIYEQVQGVYRYSVHDFTNRGTTAGSTALAASGARVRVYRGEALVRTFNVPAGVEGTLWTVFEMNGATLVPVNSMTYEESPGAVTSRGPAPAKSR